MACRREGKSRLGAISHTGPFPLFKMFACVSSRSKRTSHTRVSVFYPATCASSGHPSHQQNLCHAKSLWFAATFLLSEKSQPCSSCVFIFGGGIAMDRLLSGKGSLARPVPFPCVPINPKMPRKIWPVTNMFHKRTMCEGIFGEGIFHPAVLELKLAPAIFYIYVKRPSALQREKEKQKGENLMQRELFSPSAPLA